MNAFATVSGIARGRSVSASTKTQSVSPSTKTVLLLSRWNPYFRSERTLLMSDTHVRRAMRSPGKAGRKYSIRLVRMTQVAPPGWPNAYLLTQATPHKLYTIGQARIHS